MTFMTKSGIIVHSSASIYPVKSPHFSRVKQRALKWKVQSLIQMSPQPWHACSIFLGRDDLKGEIVSSGPSPLCLKGSSAENCQRACCALCFSCQLPLCGVERKKPGPHPHTPNNNASKFNSAFLRFNYCYKQKSMKNWLHFISRAQSCIPSALSEVIHETTHH